MYTAEVTFRSESRRLSDGSRDAIHSLAAAWLKSGQVVSDDYALTVDGAMCQVVVRIPERNSLSPRFASPWVRESVKGLRSVGVSSAAVRILGEVADTAPTVRPSSLDSLILFTTFLEQGPPLRCGDSFRYVPLYRVLQADPIISQDLLSWEAVYRACDQLWMNSDVGERFGVREMSLLGSRLSQMGRELCSRVESHAGLPTYYYLYKHHARSVSQEKKRQCPGCGKAWLLKEPLFNLFDFRCDKCRLVSNIGFDVEPGLRLR